MVSHKPDSFRDAGELRAIAFNTDLGWIAILHRGMGIVGLQFGHPSATSLKRFCETRARETGRTIFWAEPNREERRWIRELERYAQGKPSELNQLPLEESRMTPFQREVRRVCRQLPAGTTATYGELAQRVGRPGAARAVGTVMSRNPTPLLVPCHRVVGVSGLGGFSAPQGLAMKRLLLHLERGESCGGCEYC